MAATEIKVRMQQRRDTAAGWTSADPVLLTGELGYETDTGYFKLGDGSTAWSSLAYLDFSKISAYPLETADLADDAVTSAKIADGTIVNADVNASAAIADTKLDTISTAGKVSNSATTATDANTASAIVARDASGDFSAGTITADLSGNASTVTTNANLTGDVTSVGNATSIAAGAIVDADVNASAAIAGTKIDPDFGSQTVETTGVFSAAGGAAATPSIAFTGDLDTGIYSPGANQIALATNGTGRLFVDSSGNVGVGTASPARYPLHVHRKSTSDATIHLTNDSTGSTDSDGLSIFAGTSTSGIWSRENVDFRIATNSIERLRIDSSGRLLVGTSSALSNISYEATSTLSPKIQLVGSDASTAHLGVVRTSGNGPADLTLGWGSSGNLAASDQDIGAVLFSAFDGTSYKNAAYIQCEADGAHASGDTPGRLVFSTTKDGQSSPTEAVRITSTQATIFTGDIRPSIDNNIDVGGGSLRWRTIYAATGTINTSDANLKQDIESLEAAEISVATAIRGLIKKFRFVDAVEIKGDDARIHVGVIAQEVEQAFVDAGLDPRRYGLFCEDELEDGTKRLAIRYDELLAFVIAAL